MMFKKISFIHEVCPGEKWKEYYLLAREAYLKWFRQEGDSSRPSIEDCEIALNKYMPEFVGLWNSLKELVSATEEEARMLSLYCPSVYQRGGSQAMWLKSSPIMIKNYDLSPDLFEGRIVKTKWIDTEVIGVVDCLWGMLDGINEHGVCISITYGGNDLVGKGFSISIIVRYALEFCKTTKEVIEVFRRIPVNMAYNVSVLDKYSHSVTIELSPFTNAKVSFKPFAINHQGDFDISNYSLFANSDEKQETIKNLLYDPLVSIESFTRAFSYEPLFSKDYEKNFGTLYTAIYNPGLRASEFRLPGNIIVYQSFSHFDEVDFYVYY